MVLDSIQYMYNGVIMELSPWTWVGYELLLRVGFVSVIMLIRHKTKQ